MKKILVATDASEYSRKALQKAMELARIFQSEIELLSVVNIEEVKSYGQGINPQEQIEYLGEQAIKATLEGIDSSDVTITKKTMQGKPANMILQEIEDQKIDIVVMGSHGYGAVTGAILGSVSQRVLHGAKCSVFIAK